MSILNSIKELNIYKLKNSPNLNKIFQIFSNELNDVDSVLNNLLTILDIDNLTGSNLDFVGDIISQKRLGMDDDDYKTSIKLKISKNTSSATVNNIIDIAKRTTDSSKCIYTGYPPAGYKLFIDGQNINSNLKNDILKLSSAGVSVDLSCSYGEENKLIMLELDVTEIILQDNDGNNLQDNNGEDLIANLQTQFPSDINRRLFGGGPMGYLQIDNLQDNDGNNLQDNNGEDLIFQTSEIIGSSKMNLIL